VAELARREQTFVLAIVGDGPERDDLQKRTAELGLADRVRFLGWRDDLGAIYAGSDVIALSSINEGTPVCLIEAMAANRAVVSTDVGGVRDVLEDGRLGLIVPPEANAFADALHTLLSDGALREQFGRDGAAAAHSRFGVQRLLDDMESLYDELLLESGLVSQHASTVVSTS
jgi:glycosyltransferase involved in cell wall biosynthesis